MTFQDDFKGALAAARKAGVKIRQNVSGCCRSCISADSETKLGISDEAAEVIPYAWTYGGQGNAYRWENGEPEYAASARGWYGRHSQKVEQIYFNHGGPGVFAAEVLKREFEARGITVDWNGSGGMCVVVITPYGLERQAERAAEELVKAGK